MSKASTMAKTSARGSFNIFWGLAISTIISAVSLVILGQILEPAEYGVVAIALVAPQFITIFTDLGINSAIVKYTAQFRAEDKSDQIKEFLTSGIAFQVILGGILAILCFLLSGFLARGVLQRPNIEPLIKIASVTIFTGVLATTAQSIFIGYERMELYSIVQILQAAIKGILVSALVIVGFGSFGAIVGTSIASVISGASATLIFYFGVYKHSLKAKTETLKIIHTIKTMLKYGLPLSASTILSGSVLQLYNFLIAIYSSDTAIGNYNVAVTFIVFITFFITPISTVLFPVFSKIDPVKETETLTKAFLYSVKYAALFIAPVSAALLALAGPAVTTVFGQKYVDAPLYLALSVLVMYVYSSFGSLTIEGFLNGLGKTKVTLKLTIACLVVGLPLSLLLIPRFGVVGLIVTTLAAGAPNVIVGLWWIKKHYALEIEWASSIKILISSAFAALVTYLIVNQMVLFSWLELFIGAVIFMVTYITVIPLIGAIGKADIQNLKQMLHGVGIVSKLLGFPLKIMEKLSRKE